MTIYNRESTHQFWSTSHVQVFILQNVDNCIYSLARVRQNMCTSLEWVRNSNLFTKPMWSCGVSYEQPPHDGSIVSPFTFYFGCTDTLLPTDVAIVQPIMNYSAAAMINCVALSCDPLLSSLEQNNTVRGGKQSVKEPRLLTAKSKTLLLQTLNCDLTSDI